MGISNESMTDSLHTLATWLAGEYENSAQAIAEPIWFVNLRLWYRPLAHRLEGNLAFFAEQANVLQLDQPYRQRIAVLEADQERLAIQYWAFRHPEQFRGAGTAGDRLSQITLADLEALPGCRLTVTVAPSLFRAELEPGSRCCFQYQGKTRQVVLGLEVSPNQLKSFDRGVDPETGDGLWGALMGPYQFIKCRDFSPELPL
jgi:hypothetical protein